MSPEAKQISERNGRQPDLESTSPSLIMPDEGRKFIHGSTDIHNMVGYYTWAHTHTYIIKSTHTQSSLELDTGVNSNYDEAEPAHTFEALERSKLTCMPKKRHKDKVRWLCLCNTCHRAS